jgi:hypothetical protein
VQRVILSLFTAVIIAISEGALFLIWHSRPSKKRRLWQSMTHKKEDDSGKESTALPDPRDAVLSSTGIHVPELRQRK